MEVAWNENGKILVILNDCYIVTAENEIDKSISKYKIFIH